MNKIGNYELIFWGKSDLIYFKENLVIFGEGIDRRDKKSRIDEIN